MRLCLLRLSAAALASSIPLAAAAESKAEASGFSALPIAVAIVAATAAYLFNTLLERRKSKLKLISDQLQHLYGPLYSLSHAGHQAWLSFRKRYRPNSEAYFHPNAPPTLEELEAWRHWVAEVFMPINTRMENIIIENAHLIQGDGMPREFLEFLAHVETYNAVTKMWPKRPVSVDMSYDQIRDQHTALRNFPPGLYGVIEKSYLDLKKRQDALMTPSRSVSDIAAKIRTIRSMS